MSVDGFEIVETVGLKTHHPGSLTQNKEITMSHSARDLMLRARRAETSARALEVILRTQSQDSRPLSQQISVASAVDEDTVSIDGVVMTSEDYRSRLVLVLQELESAKAALVQTKEQQKIDAENIESLQSSLERLHNLVAEYRRDKDNTDTEFTELLELARSLVGDKFIGLADLKDLIRSGPEGSQLGISNAEREELETQLANWSTWSEKITQELTERDELLQAKETELGDALSKLTDLESTLRLKDIQLLDSTEKAKQKSALVDSFTMELETLRNELADASALKVLVETVNAERDLLREEINAAQIKLDETIEKLESSRREMDELVSLARSTLGDDIIDIQSLREFIHSGLPAPAASLSDEERDELEVQLAKWSEWSTEVTQELAQRDELLNEKETELTSANVLVAEMQSKIDILRAELEALRAIREQLEKVQAERDRLRLDDRGKQFDELIEVGKKYSEKELVDLDELKTLIERGSQVADQAASTLKLSELSGQLAAKETELTGTLGELMEYKSRLNEMNLMETDRAYYVKKLEAELKDLRHQLADSSRINIDIEHIRIELDKARAEMDSLKSIAITKTGENDVTLEDLKKIIGSINPADESNVAELESQLSNWEEWSKQVNQELADRDKLLNEKETALAQSMSEIENLRARIENRETVIGHSQTDIALEEHFEELNALRSKLQSVEYERDSLHDQVNAARADLVEAVGKSKTASDQLAELVHLAQSVAGDESVRVEDLKDFIKSGTEGSMSALEELNRCLGRSPRTMMKEQERELEDKETEIDQLKTRLESRELEVEELAKLVVEQKQTAAKYSLEIEKLRAQIEQVIEKNEPHSAQESDKLSGLIEFAKSVAEKDSIDISDLRNIIAEWKDKTEVEKQLAHWVEWSKEMTHQLEERDQIIDKKEAEMHALVFEQTEASTREKDQQLTTMKIELNALVIERDELKRKEIELQAVISEREPTDENQSSKEIARLTSQIERLEAERDLFSEEMEEVKLKLEKTEAILKTEQQSPKPINEGRVSELETELAAKTDVIADMEKKLNEWAVWADFMIAELKAKEAAVTGTDQAPQSKDIEF